MNAPKISIIIPVYKAEKYIAKTIELILKQNFSDFELILVDDGSPDNSGAICDEYSKKDSRIKVFHQENQGAGAARNVGLDNAQGEFISFIDADDEIAEDYLDTIVESFEKNKDSDILVFEVISIIGGIKDDNLQNKDNSFKSEILKIKKYDNKLFETANMAIWNKAYKRLFLRENKLYFQNIKSCNDICFSLLVINFSKNISYLNKALYYYNRTSEDAISRSRKKTSLCVIEAVKASIQKLESLNAETSRKNAIYEFSTILFCNEYRSSTQKREFRKAAKKFLPYNFYSKFFFRIMKNKILTILGIRK